MKDRIPVYPGRIQLVPSAADDDLFVLTRADDPTQEGTPLNKASLLSDATAAAIGLSQSDPTVNDALGFLAANYSRTLSGTAAPGLNTPAKRGDIYVQDNGGGRRYIYVCDAVGEKPVDLGEQWERGSLADSSVTNAAASYRVRSDAVFIPAGTKFSIASGFRFGLRFMDADRNYTSSKSLNTSSYTADSDKLARILIARTTDNTSETADVAAFSSALTMTASGTHWTAVGAAHEVEKEIVFTSSGVFTVPADLRGSVTIRAFGGGAGGSTASGGYGGGGGHMAVYTGTLTAKRYNVTIGAGGAAGEDGGASSFGSLVTANGGSGPDGGSGGGGGNATGALTAGDGSYGGGGGGGIKSAGGDGGTYGGGGGGGGHESSGTYYQYKGGSGKNGARTASSPTSGTGCGTGGAGYSANGAAASSSHGSNGGAGTETNGFSIPFEGTGTAGTYGTRGGGGGGGYGGNGGNGNMSGGGGGGYGANGGNGSTLGGGGGGGFGGRGGNGTANGGGGGGGYGLSGNGGDAGKPGGTAAGGGCGAAGGSGIVIITYTGVEVI